MNWVDFFNMGGYAFFVWTSWGLTAIIFLALFISAKVRRANITTQLQRQLQRADKYQS